MVKVISAYNFQEQNTYSINADIVDTCLIGNDRLAIAQRNHLIEILCLKHKNDNNLTTTGVNIENVFQNDQNKNSPPTKTMFPTVDQVQKLLYCKAGHFLLTLECKTDTHTELKKRFIRIYVNFDIAEIDNCYTTPIRARIASKITPKTDSTNCIEVIEIPFNGNPDLIACCQISGTIVISSGKCLYFYEFQNRANLAQKFTFIDFIEVPFYIELEFIPKKLKICENVISCMNEITIIAFKIIDLIETNTEDGSTSNSLTTGSSANIFNQSTNIPIDYEVAKQCNQINGIELQLKIHSNWDTVSNGSKTNFSEEKPISVNDVKILLKYYNEYNNEHDGIFYSIKSLLQLRQPAVNKIPGQIHDEFRSIALKPIYYKYQHKSSTINNDIRKSSITNNDTRHIFKSSNYMNCIGFSFFVSTVSDGYLYQFTNQEKWYIENTKCLATYPFTAPVLDVIIDNYVIHAITECGIETFSSRVGHKLFSSYYEYPMLASSNSNENFFQIGPLLDVPICVMGICGFFGIKFVVNSDTNLILLSTCDDDNKITTTSTTVTTTINKKNFNRLKNNDDTITNDWTLYNLKLPKPELLINDIKNLANIYKNSCPDVYYELMEEAYVIIRLARIFIDNNDNDYDSEEKDQQNEILEKIFIEICQLLAEYTIMSDRKEIYSQSVAYYSMCKYPVLEIYKRYIENIKELNNDGDDQQQNEQKEQEEQQYQQQQQVKNYNNLIYTLKILITSLKSNKTDAEYLTENIKPILNLKQKSSNHNVAEEFLDFFKLYAPNEIAPICLISAVFREIINDSLIEFFNQKPMRKLSGDEQLCLILCLFKKQQIKKSIEILDKMKPINLLESLKKYWIILFDDNFHIDNYRISTFSDFTELILFSTHNSKIIEVIADIFIHLLLITHYIDLDFILNRFMNYFAINLGQNGYHQSQQILEIILQNYFYDLYYLSNNRNIMIMTTTTTTTTATATPAATIHLDDEQINNLTTATTTGLSTAESHHSISAYLMNSHDQLPTAIQTKTTTNNHIQDYNYEDAEQEAMKILFRMYLGWLKQYSDQKQQHQQINNKKIKNGIIEIDDNLLNDQIFGYRLAFIEYMYNHSKIIKRIHTKFDKTYSSDLSYGSDQMASLYDDNAYIQTIDNDENDINSSSDDNDENIIKKSNKNIDDKSKLLFRRRPILFFERREQFLNTMPPFDENSFKLDITNGTLYFNDWDKNENIILIKIQALLNSGKLNGNLIDDFLTFIHSNPNIIGIDSLITILLPKPEGEEFLIYVMPKNLLNYAKSRLTSLQQWQAFIKRILNRKRTLADSETETIKFYDKIIYEILEYLANTKTLEEFLSCIPEEELNKNQNRYNFNNSTKLIDENEQSEQLEQQQQEQYQINNDDDNNTSELRKHSYDGIDETDPFQLIMRTVVAKQRSDALCAMIQSTGRQLYDAMNNSQLHLN